MVKKIIVSGMSMAFSLGLSAQTDSGTIDKNIIPAFSISGSIDGYYKYDFGKAASNGLTSFTQTHDRFELGMASAKMQYQSSKTKIVLDLGFGKKATDFSYADQGIVQAIKQAYINYAPIKNLSFTFGSWATHIGYEVVDPGSNRNYSMSYMFSTGPFLHTGVKAEYAVGKSGFMLGIANPTDYKYVPAGLLNKKFLIAQYSYLPCDAFNLYLNYAGGQWVDSSKVNQFDASIISHLNSTFWLGANGTVGLKKVRMENMYSPSKNWWGAALYLNADFSKSCGLTLREEYFNDDNSMTALKLGTNVLASTLSLNYKVNNLTIIPELRVDHGGKEIFINSSSAPTKTNVSGLIAVVYSFSN